MLLSVKMSQQRIQFEGIANELDQIEFEMIKDSWLKHGMTPQQAAQLARAEIMEERARRNEQPKHKLLERIKAQTRKIKEKMSTKYNNMIKQRNQGAGIDELEQALNGLTL